MHVTVDTPNGDRGDVLSSMECRDKVQYYTRTKESTRQQSNCAQCVLGTESVERSLCMPSGTVSGFDLHEICQLHHCHIGQKPICSKPVLVRSPYAKCLVAKDMRGTFQDRTCLEQGA